MTDRMDFFVPMKPPRTTHQTKQVRVVKGKPIFYEPADLKAARGKLLSHLSKHAPPRKLGGAIRLVTKWIWPTRSKKDHGRYKVTRPDTDNLQKLLKDVMTTLGFWHDDAQVCSEVTEKFWTTGTPGIWISVQPLDPSA